MISRYHVESAFVLINAINLLVVTTVRPHFIGAFLFLLIGVGFQMKTGVFFDLICLNGHNLSKFASQNNTIFRKKFYIDRSFRSVLQFLRIFFRVMHIDIKSMHNIPNFLNFLFILKWKFLSRVIVKYHNPITLLIFSQKGKE